MEQHTTPLPQLHSATYLRYQSGSGASERCQGLIAQASPESPFKSTCSAFSLHFIPLRAGGSNSGESGMKQTCERREATSASPAVAGASPNAFMLLGWLFREQKRRFQALQRRKRNERNVTTREIFLTHSSLPNLKRWMEVWGFFFPSIPTPGLSVCPTWQRESCPGDVTNHH